MSIQDYQIAEPPPLAQPPAWTKSQSVPLHHLQILQNKVSHFIALLGQQYAYFDIQSTLISFQSEEIELPTELLDDIITLLNETPFPAKDIHLQDKLQRLAQLIVDKVEICRYEIAYLNHMSFRTESYLSQLCLVRQMMTTACQHSHRMISLITKYITRRTPCFLENIPEISDEALTTYKKTITTSSVSTQHTVVIDFVVERQRRLSLDQSEIIRRCELDIGDSLVGEEYRIFYNAMTSSFSEQELKDLLRIHIKERPDKVLNKGGIPEQVTQLIEWAEREGRLTEIIRGAYKMKPGRLQVFVNRLPALIELIKDEMPAEQRQYDTQKSSLLITIATETPEPPIQEDSDLWMTTDEERKTIQPNVEDSTTLVESLDATAEQLAEVEGILNSPQDIGWQRLQNSLWQPPSLEQVQLYLEITPRDTHQLVRWVDQGMRLLSEMNCHLNDLAVALDGMRERVPGTELYKSHFQTTLAAYERAIKGLKKLRKHVYE